MIRVLARSAAADGLHRGAVDVDTRIVGARVRGEHEEAVGCRVQPRDMARNLALVVEGDANLLANRCWGLGPGGQEEEDRLQPPRVQPLRGLAGDDLQIQRLAVEVGVAQHPSLHLALDGVHDDPVLAPDQRGARRRRDHRGDRGDRFRRGTRRSLGLRPHRHRHRRRRAAQAERSERAGWRGSGRPRRDRGGHRPGLDTWPE